MKPSVRASLSLLLASLTLAACSGKPEPVSETATVPTEQAPLPADVQQVAADLKASPDATADGGSSEAQTSVIEATGELTSPVVSELVIRNPGRVAAVFAEEGDRVRRGQRLLALETQYLEPEVARAEAELARARAVATEAESDFGRKETLLAKNAIPQSLYDRSKANRDQSAAAVEAARVQLDLTRQRLADAVLVSPIDGFVAERRADVGERLTDVSVAFVLMQLSPLELRFQLAERYLSRVKEGQAVLARFDALPGEVFRGTLSRVGRRIETNSRTFSAEAVIANPDGRLRPGLFARVELSAESGAP